MALLVLFFAIYCVKNTTQDLIYAITGRVPPSFVREQRRMQFAREAMASRANSRPLRQPVTPGRGSRKFFRNAYNDAWETAEERRERWAEKRARKRHEKWDAEDGVPAPIETNARPEENSGTPDPAVRDWTSDADMPAPPRPVVHDDDTYTLGAGARKESLYQRYAMRRRNGGQPMTDVAVADELEMTLPKAAELRTEWDARYQREAPKEADVPPKHLVEYQQHSRCRDCGGQITLNKDPERPGQWIVGVEHTRDDCPQQRQHPTLREQHDQQVQQLADEAAQNSAGDTRPGGSTTPIEENDSVTNTETTGLQSGLAYNEEMAKTCEQGAASVEQSIAALMNGEVGQGVTGPMHQAQEHLVAAQALFDDARRTLEQQITVKEAYDANPDAGNKAFVTAE